MNETTINLTFDREFLQKLDIVAKEESKSRNELIYNSIKFYINQKDRLQDLFAYGENIALQSRITEDDIAEEIKLYRKRNENCH